MMDLVIFWDKQSVQTAENCQGSLSVMTARAGECSSVQIAPLPAIEPFLCIALKSFFFSPDVKQSPDFVY